MRGGGNAAAVTGKRCRRTQRRVPAVEIFYGMPEGQRQRSPSGLAQNKRVGAVEENVREKSASCSAANKPTNTVVFCSTCAQERISSNCHIKGAAVHKRKAGVCVTMLKARRLCKRPLWHFAEGRCRAVCETRHVVSRVTGRDVVSRPRLTLVIHEPLNQPEEKGTARCSNTDERRAAEKK